MMYTLTNGSVSAAPVQGTGADLSMAIPADWLVAGENTLSLTSTVSACQLTDAQSITITALPVFSALAESPTTICAEGTTVLQASGAPENGRYNWYSSNDLITPLDVDGAQFETPILTADETYFVSVVSEQGCEGAKLPITARVVTLAPVVIEEESGNVLVSSYATGNQWYLNGELMTGVTGQSIVADQSGTYSVNVQLDGCSTAGTYEFVVLSAELGNSNGVRVYPNPVQNRLVIKANGVRQEDVTLLTTWGTPIQVNSVLSADAEGVTFDVSALPAGVYIVKVSGSGYLSRFKILKQ